jgi:hypothetical protein
MFERRMWLPLNLQSRRAVFCLSWKGRNAFIDCAAHFDLSRLTRRHGRRSPRMLAAFDEKRGEHPSVLFDPVLE